VFVQDTIYDRFVEEAVRRFKAVRLGMPWDPDTQMGSQINERQAQKIVGYIELGKSEGARVAVGGARATKGDLAKGAYVEPTLLVDVTNDMRVAQEEIFGPVAVVIKFHDEAEVVAMANDSEYGLGGAVWTHDLSRAFRVARAVETGRMWVNTYNQLPEKAPFGGYKKSGIGRETYRTILDNYSEVKNIFIDLDDVPSGFYPAPVE
jgi:acyl-CoA reductase-like NAD-dependent aldehyde dehydrogenase